MTKVKTGRNSKSMSMMHNAGLERKCNVNGEIIQPLISNAFVYPNKINGKDVDYAEIRKPENMYACLSEEEFAERASRNTIMAGLNCGRVKDFRTLLLPNFFKAVKDFKIFDIFNYGFMNQLFGSHMTDIIKIRGFDSDGNYILYDEPDSKKLKKLVRISKKVGKDKFKDCEEMKLLILNYEIFAKECLDINGTEDEVIYLIAFGRDTETCLKGFIKWASINDLGHRFELVDQMLPHYSPLPFLKKYFENNYRKYCDKISEYLGLGK